MAVLLKFWGRFALTAALFFLCFCRESDRNVFSRVEAMDPVTIAVLAPVAMKVAKDFSPSIMRSMQCTGYQMVAIGTDFLHIFYLPWGILQGIFGTPFGYGGAALQKLSVGAVAPFKMVLDVCLLPLAFFGIYGSR